ncbi:MAG: aminoacyl-tRNA hydrolase [Oscillospiraceae bacterium]|nr:aminoacyl-tRNA hydrolase [Oscillospiraceae bacterium]
MFRNLFKRKSSGVSWIVAGLGNPDTKYDGTRHNMGFLALDYLAEKRGVPITRSKFQGLTATVKYGDQQVLYLKPMTYMNLSGNSVGEAARFYKVPADHVIVLCDDITLPAGTIRLRDKGSAGGHNGLKSIISQLGGDGFLRIKIGVGGNAPTGDELVDFVLSKPSKEEMEAVRNRYPDIDGAVDLMIQGNFSLAQSKYNGKGK